MAGVGYVAPISQPNYVNNASGAYTASNDNTLLTAIAEAELTSSLNQDDAIFSVNDNVASDGTALNESLLSNLNTQALLALNDVANTNTATNFGILTPVQLQDFATLQADIQLLTLNDTNSTTTGIAINDNGTNVNLSPEALDLLAEITAENSISAANGLSPTQVQQAAGIIAPFLGAPLTPTIVTQIDNSLSAAGFSPQQISLENLYLSMNYAAAETQVPNETLALEEVMAESEDA